MRRFLRHHVLLFAAGLSLHGGPTAAAGKLPFEREIVTRYGTVTIERRRIEGRSSRADVLLVNGQEVRAFEDVELHLARLPALGERDVVLLAANAWHTQWYPDLGFLMLAREAAPAVFLDERGQLFTSHEEVVSLWSATSDAITVDLGFEGKNRKLMQFDGTRTIKRLLPAARVALPLDQCKAVYEEPYAYCMTALPPPGENRFSGRHLYRAWNHPGFQDRPYIRLCESAHGTHKLVDYRTFAVAVCSRR